jgi:hypothetical protein
MPQPALLGKLQRKASHRNKESVKLRFHVVVYSVTGAPRSVGNAIFSLERGEHAFESNTAAQARTRAMRATARASGSTCAAAVEPGAAALAKASTGCACALRRGCCGAWRAFVRGPKR